MYHTHPFTESKSWLDATVCNTLSPSYHCWCWCQTEYILVMYSKHIVVDVHASTKPSCQSKYTCFLLLLFDTAKPFSEVNIMTEVRYSPPNKPLPSPPPSPPFCKTDLEPVYEVIAWWKRTRWIFSFLQFIKLYVHMYRLVLLHMKVPDNHQLKLINCNHNFWCCMEIRFFCCCCCSAVHVISELHAYTCVPITLWQMYMNRSL